jgi:hypothetical protein
MEAGTGTPTATGTGTATGARSGPGRPFEESLAGLGFAFDRESRGVRHFHHRPNAYLTYWLQTREDDTALFTWEFAIAEYAARLGLQVGSDEHLNTFLFPREDATGPQEPAWVAAQIERTEAVLRSVRLLDED